MSRNMSAWAILMGVLGAGACVTVLTVRRRREKSIKRWIRHAGKILMSMPSAMMSLFD